MVRRMMRRFNWRFGFLLGCIAMLTLQSTILQPPHSSTSTSFLSFSTSSLHSSSSFLSPSLSLSSSSWSLFPSDCHGLPGMKVLLLGVHLEGNLGDEMETMPLLEELKRCGVHITAFLSRWLERPEQRIGGGSVREHALIDVIFQDDHHRHSSLADTATRTGSLMVQDYQVVLLAPGPWRLCSIQEYEYWPHRIDIFMSGSILTDEQQRQQPDVDSDSKIDCDLAKRFESWNPSLLVVREPYSFRILHDISSSLEMSGVTTYMSGDLSHSFRPVNSTLNYWKGMYHRTLLQEQQQQQQQRLILIFARGSNAANVVQVKGRNVELMTLDNGPVLLPISKVIFATSSVLEDAAWMLEWQERNMVHFQEYQFVQCQTVEQLWALVSISTHVYTDRYHPGVVAHLFDKPVTILEYKMEQSKLVGLAQFIASQEYSPVAIRNQYNVQAFHLLRSTLRRLKDRIPSNTTMTKTDNNAMDVASETQKTESDSAPKYHTGEQPYAIVVGMPKSGTTSVYQFFSCSGYHTTHYCCCGSNATEYPCAGGKLFSQQLHDNLKAGRPLWEGTGDMFVHAQLDGESTTETYFLPQHYNLKELDESAPNAFWILPLRPAAKWKHSVQKWLDLEQRLRMVHEERNDYRSAEKFDLESFYENHTKMIRDYCKNFRQSTDLCVEVDIDNPEAGNLLRQHFKDAVPRCWGRHNAGPFFQAIPAKL